MVHSNDTITAVATGVGGAIAVIRLSGARAVEICDSVFRPKSAGRLADAKGYTLHYGEIVDGADGRVVDDVIVSLFKAPRSYTGEDMVEISCHGSQYIQQEIIKLLIRQGARPATAGEFTVRAFLAGKLDLSQAEAVADIIASTDKATHALASNQMRGGYSSDFNALRDELLNLVSLLELELDFGEEDVEFADRTRLVNLITDVEAKVGELLGSFSLSNVIKEGIAVAIVGEPNVGKSTLLNAMLKDDRAMVSDIAGTTRDVIEESLNINGVRFRFIDTAGIRNTDDRLEQMGIERTFSSIGKANIVLLMSEAEGSLEDSVKRAAEMMPRVNVSAEQKTYIVINKYDKIADAIQPEVLEALVQKYCKGTDGACHVDGAVAISAKYGTNIDALTTLLSDSVDTEAVYNGSTIVSNSRHYEALHNASDALQRAHAGMTSGLPSDLLSQDIRESLHYLGLITGEITTDDVLGSIFSKFCIGK